MNDTTKTTKATKPTTTLTYEAYYAEYGCIWVLAEVFPDGEIRRSSIEEYTRFNDAADRADEIEAAGHIVNRTWK